MSEALTNKMGGGHASLLDGEKLDGRLPCLCNGEAIEREPASSVSPDVARPAHTSTTQTGNVCSAEPRGSLIVCIATILLLIHAGMVGWLAARWSPNVDEPAHLAAGLAGWQYGSFEFYCVNPPLVRAVAALPILAMSPEKQWGDFRRSGARRRDFALGTQLVESHPGRWRLFLVAARWAILPFSIAGALFCYAWATELFGRKAGVMATMLWCFSPNILTWSAVICTDGAAAALGVGAGYTFWRWLKLPSWPRAAAAGIVLGLAQLSKMTWLPLFVLWPALWVFWVLRQREQKPRKQQGGQLASILLMGLYVLNLGYAFDGSFTRLGEYRFHSRLLTGERRPLLSGPGENRFAGSLLGQLPVPLPKHYARGLDLQRVDFETGHPSYLFGRWLDRGWWYYYVVGFAFKVPLGTWGLAILAVVFSLPSFRRNDAREAPVSSPRTGEVVGMLDQMVLLAPALMVFAVVSSQDGMSRHFRYVLPALPFVYIWVSKVARSLRTENLSRSAAVTSCLVWTLGSSLAVFPHSMSYFNGIVGGPANGHRYMLHSTFSWSQDDFYLKRWLESHPEVEAPYMDLERSVPLQRLGLRSRGQPPKGIMTETERYDPTGGQLGPIPGWHVMSVQRIHDPDGGYLYFFKFEPLAHVGYSIDIYHITLAQANTVRRAMGLDELQRSGTSPDAVVSEMAIAANSTKHVHAAIFAIAGPNDGRAQAVRNAVTSHPGLSIVSLSREDILAGKLAPFDVLIVPGGRATDQGKDLGEKGRDAIRHFVESGGGYVGICAGAFLATAKYPWSLKLVNAQTLTGMRYVPGLGEQQASFRGSALVDVELSDAGRDVLGTGAKIDHIGYSGGPILLPTNECALPDYICLGHFRSEVCKYGFQKGTMINSPAIVAARFGQGHIILFSPHTDKTAGLESWVVRSIRACARRIDSRAGEVGSGRVAAGSG